MDFRISTGSYSEFVTEIINHAASHHSIYVCVANVHMFVEAHKDSSFKQIIDEADMVTPDGKPLTWALNLLNKISQERVAGMDLFPSLLQASEESGLSVYFYGGSETMLNTLENKVRERFPSLTISGKYSPPFRQLTKDEDAAIINRINDVAPHLVFVALGCPKQERWMYAMKGKINATMIGVGGALPVFAGLQKRAPVWMQKSGLEWLHRLGQEPRRLFKRYAVTNSTFLYLTIREFFRQKLSPGKKPLQKEDPVANIRKD